jgi:pimeloyl-ACP methyl ester carboxylesterase
MPARLWPEGGTGPDLVLIHGFGADRLGWAATVPAFLPTHRVWTIDLPWHGGAGPGETDPVGMAAEVSAALAPLAGPITLVGHSLGGAIACLLCSHDPARFARPILIAPAGLGAGMWAGLDRDFLTGFAELATEDAAQAHLRRLVVRDRLIAPAMAQHVLDGLADPARRQALAAIAGSLPYAGALECPDVAHVIWGSEDRINPQDPARADAWGDRFTLLPATGHLPQVEAATKVNRIIAAALA